MGNAQFDGTVLGTGAFDSCLGKRSPAPSMEKTQQTDTRIPATFPTRQESSENHAKKASKSAAKIQEEAKIAEEVLRSELNMLKEALRDVKTSLEQEAS
uniref:Uncharacterized protein n=1 Tax=Chromera velia CCMP2878 TaxID=1169474 RepID=A0A0G4HQ31_9ALVE|eukprot:Cvel_30035.t1-p1 / transcript=Cvel_30035.t1 / gene=Cvel_30035 / organism=Chromera_velia_CCMP2878 / gene_product=hypothetical protein / transcript_product=hypothetical protein / location=Cvel_scaffold4220:7749-8537(+) / protein_length=98 / sequence_SO=supercontig / SO=protein_coding / is_pseudo=false